MPWCVGIITAVERSLTEKNTAINNVSRTQATLSACPVCSSAQCAHSTHGWMCVCVCVCVCVCSIIQLPCPGRVQVAGTKIPEQEVLYTFYVTSEHHFRSEILDEIKPFVKTSRNIGTPNAVQYIVIGLDMSSNISRNSFFFVPVVLS